MCTVLLFIFHKAVKLTCLLPLASAATSGARCCLGVFLFVCACTRYFYRSRSDSAGPAQVSYQEALAAIFIEGWIFILLSVLGAPALVLA